MDARRYSPTSTSDFGPNTLVRRAGYPLPVGYGLAPGDNSIESIVAGRATPAAALAAWLASPGQHSHYRVLITVRRGP